MLLQTCQRRGIAGRDRSVGTHPTSCNNATYAEHGSTRCLERYDTVGLLFSSNERRRSYGAKSHHALVDDLTGDTIDEGKGCTMSFSFDGNHYEIDLSDDNAEALREAFSDYVAAARKVSGRQNRTSGGTTAKRGNSTSSRRSASGRTQTATRSPAAAASARPSATRTTPRTRANRTPRATLASSTARPELGRTVTTLTVRPFSLCRR